MKLGIPHPKIGQPFLTLDGRQGGVQSEIVTVPVLEQVVEQHCVALAGPHLEALVVGTALGKGGLPARLGARLVRQIHQQSKEPRVGVTAHSPVVV